MAQPVLELRPGDRPATSLTESFAVLQDPSRSLTLADVQAPDTAARFTTGQAPAHALSLGYTRSAFWLRLRLRNASAQPVERMLEIANPLLSNVQFHEPLADVAYRTIATGAAQPFSTRPYRNRFFVFPLTLAPYADQAVYLRVESTSAILIPAVLWELQAFHAHERDDYAAQAWYFGMVAAMVLFNLLLFAALRDVVYLMYVAFAVFFPLTIMSLTGLGKEFLWPDTTLWSNVSLSVFGSFTLMSLLLFMRRLLRTAELIPRVDGVIRLFIAIQIPFPLAFLISLESVSRLSIALLIATQFLVLFVGLYCAVVKREPLAMVFLVAFFMFVVGVLAVGLRALTLLPSNAFTIHGFQIGSALEMLLMALALAYRFVLIRRKAVEDVEQANAGLAQRLQAREAELTQSHLRLREIEHSQTLSQERQRLTQDMHDGVGSSLSTALQVVERGQLDGAQVAQVLKGCIDDLKLVIDAMEPVDADLLLLLATLRFRLGPRLESSGIALRWEVQDVPALDWLDPGSSLHILRIVQEAFANIIKHANATQIRVATHADADGVVVTIADNGRGFPAEAARKQGGKGLSNQARRAQIIGAQIGWEASDAGTRLTLWLPIRRPALHAQG